MKLFDGQKKVEIILRTAEGIDWTNDFFGAMETYSEAAGEEVVTVDDVDYCVDQVEDMMNGRGDYQDVTSGYDHGDTVEINF